VDGTSMFGISFFVCLVFLGPFFIVNLFLAVLKIKFADSSKKDNSAKKEEETEEQMLENKRRRYSGKNQHSSTLFAEEKEEEEEDSEIDPHAVKETVRLPPAAGELEAASARAGPVSEAVSSLKDAHGVVAANDSHESVRSIDLGASVKRLFTTSSSTKVKDEKTFEQILAGRPRIARDIYWFVQHEKFNTFFLLAIGFNTACLSLDRFDMSDSLEAFLETSNLVLTLLFLFELVLKMVGLTPRYYFKDSFNCFDFVIVMISLVRSPLRPGSREPLARTDGFKNWT
jgi:hypothetical protein